jgi:Xaa-Pro aminopeptidase
VNVLFEKFELPDLGQPGDVPELPPYVFQARLAQLESAREHAGLDAIVIYADREHAANMAWLTGFSPRFEEAIWVQVAGRKPTLLLGNENLEFARHVVPLECDFVLYQTLSLADQPRNRNVRLEQLVQHAGLGINMRVGLVGWKPMPDLDVPHWIVRAVQDVTNLQPVNAAHLLMDAGSGLRTVMEPEMIQFAEHAGRITSRAIRAAIFNIKIGSSERQIANDLVSHGLELSCHPMVNFARNMPSGLGSPRNRRAEHGGYAQVAFGVIGSLTCRGGRVVMPSDTDADDYLEIVTNYLLVVRAWYAGLRVGATGGEVFQAANATRNTLWDFALNPGHLIHLDEWLSSPFYAGSRLKLQSGTAIQQDIIPMPHSGNTSGNAVLNMEDGLILADGELRNQLRELDPALMQRCRARRDWMHHLGYALHEDVLPVSDMAGAFFPFLLEPEITVRFG